VGYYMSGGYYRAGGYYRGGFFGKVGKALGKAAGLAQQLAPVATMVNPGLGMAMGSIGGMGSQLLGGKTASPGAPQTMTIGGAQPSSPFLVTLGGGKQNLVTQPAMMGSPAGEVLGGGLVWKKKPGRRMNPLNPRALSRAYRRLNSASKWAHRLFNVAKPRHGVRPKFGRRRSR